MAKKPAKWLSVREAAEELGVSKPVVYRLIQKGEITWRNPGSCKTEVLASDVEERKRPKGGAA